jgi:hypothetical protein
VVIELEATHGCEPGTDLDQVVAHLSLLVHDNVLHARRHGFVRRSQPLQSFLCRRIVMVDKLAAQHSAARSEGGASINSIGLRIDVATYEKGIESKSEAVRRFFYSKAVRDEMAYLDAAAASPPPANFREECDDHASAAACSADVARKQVGMHAERPSRHGQSLKFGTISEGPLKGISFNIPTPHNGANASSSKYCHTQDCGARRRSPSSARPPTHFAWQASSSDDA